MAGWATVVIAYAAVSRLAFGFVFVGLLTGFLIVVELTTSNRDPPAWHRWARLVLGVGYLVYAVLLSRKLPEVGALGLDSLLPLLALLF